MSDPNNEILCLLRIFHEKKIKELEGCFEDERKEFEDSIKKLREEIAATDNDIDRLDDEITKGKQREENIDQIKKLWDQRKQDFVGAQNQLEGRKENVVNSFQTAAKNTKQQLLSQVEDCSSQCRSKTPPSVQPLPEIQDDSQQPVKKATKETEFSFEALKKLKEDNDKLLDKLLLVRAKILTFDKVEVGEEKRLEEENWILNEQIKAISGRMERQARGQETSEHLDNLELCWICLLEEKIKKMEF